MEREATHIESFGRFLSDQPQSERPFLLLDPGGDHRYLFKQSRGALRQVASLVGGEGLQRSLGSYTLRGCSYLPSVARLVPLVSQTTVRLPEDYDFDVGIVSNRTRLIQLDERTVYTLPTDDEEGIVKEATVRQRLPDGINTPEFYERDLEYPYFAEAFISGRRPKSPDDDWPVIESALLQLEALYRQREARIETASLVSEIERELESRALLDASPFRAALSMLDTLALPEYVYESPVHGDLHARNVLESDGEVYILDWENYGRGRVFEDFFKPFAVSHYDTRDPTLFGEFVDGDGRGGAMFDSYMERLGEYVCSDPRPYAGLPVLYLLADLASEERRGLWESYRELLASLVSARS